jgi:glycosyltransferase involved in cell wall biosynthesis
MTATVFVDAAGGTIGGAGRFRIELYQYLARTGREDVRLIGAFRRIDPAWLLRREMNIPTRARRVALNNLGFLTPGGERWTRLGNPLDFLTDKEWSELHPSLRNETRLRAPIVRMAARRSDVIVTPSTAMAERVGHIMPSLRHRIIPRLNPVSPDSIPKMPCEPVILCPVIFYPYKHMIDRITEWITAVDEHIDPSVRMLVTADKTELPDHLARHPRIEVVGRLSQAELRLLWGRSQAIYFPTGLESFGFPLAEARVNGQPVIARDTSQNQEIAGPALCGYKVGDADSLRDAVERALTTKIAPDPAPFEADSYFTWLLGPPQ